VEIYGFSPIGVLISLSFLVSIAWNVLVAALAVEIERSFETSLESRDSASGTTIDEVYRLADL
jgi:hypothetical protein